MLLSKLCDEADSSQVEATLCSLLIQLFDKKYNSQNSLVKSILSVFFRNFVLFSERRCGMLLNALTKVFWASVTARYKLKKAGKVAGKIKNKARKRGV